MENFIFCVVNVTGFTTQSYKFFFEPNCQSLVCFTSIDPSHRLVSSLLFRKHVLVCSKGLKLNILQTAIG